MSIFDTLGKALDGVGVPLLAKTALTIATGGTANPVLMGVASHAVGAILGALGADTPSNKDAQPPAIETMAEQLVGLLANGITADQTNAIKKIETDMEAEYKLKEIDLQQVIVKAEVAMQATTEAGIKNARDMARDMGLTMMHYAMTIFVILGLSGLVFVSLASSGLDDWQKGILSGLIGVMTREFNSVMHFLFGSSAGSKLKSIIKPKGKKDE